MPHLRIPQRVDAPETGIFLKILKNENLNSAKERPVMILIHGGPGGNHILFSDIEKELLDYSDLILLDLRGCGLSDKSDVHYCTLDIHINDINSIIEILNITNPIIHGCSYGAIVALGYGIKYPQKISKLILSSCAVSGQFIERAKTNLLKIGTPAQIEVANKLWNGNFENHAQFSAFYNIMKPLYIYNSDNNQPPTATQIPYNIELINFAFTTFLRKFNFVNELANVKAPTLIFSGKDDWIIDKNEGKIIHRGIKGSTLICMDYCGHFPWKDRRIDFLTHIKKFIAR